jgi:hypothetical protein
MAFLRVFAALVALALAFGCARQPAEPSAPVAKRAPLKKIALVPAREPDSLSVENRGGPAAFFALPGYLIQRNAQQKMSADLTAAARNLSLKLGEEMTAALRGELVAKGYEVVLVADVPRPKDDPNGVDYGRLKTDADGVLTVDIFGTGLYSGQFSTDYLPRLNVTVYILSRNGQEDIFSHSVYYGADAGEAAEDQIPSDPKYTYSSFEVAMQRHASIVESYRAGIKGIAALMAQQLRAAGL